MSLNLIKIKFKQVLLISDKNEIKFIQILVMQDEEKAERIFFHISKRKYQSHIFQILIRIT